MMPCTMILSYHEVMSHDAHATAVQEIFIRESPQMRVSLAHHGQEVRMKNALATADI